MLEGVVQLQLIQIIKKILASFNEKKTKTKNKKIGTFLHTLSSGFLCNYTASKACIYNPVLSPLMCVS